MSGLLVKFDELNPSLAAKSIVPKSGEIMASRWAFEALVVNQFKNNAYEKNIYSFEKEIVKASYKKGLWYNKMMELLDNKDDVSKQIIRNELAGAGFKGALAHSINLTEAKSFLTALKQSNIDSYKKYTALLDNYFTQHASAELQKQMMEQNKLSFHNARIEELVKNNRPLEEGIYAESNSLHPNENNIFYDASKNHQVRSHFYAPKKYFAGNYYNTYFVNLLVILGMTIICLIALYYNLLSKLINGIQDITFKIQLKKGHKI